MTTPGKTWIASEIITASIFDGALSHDIKIKESHEIRNHPPLDDLLHGLPVVRALSVLPGLDCGDRPRPDLGSRAGYPRAEPHFRIFFLYLCHHADSHQHVPRCHRAEDCHDRTVAAGSGRGIGFCVWGINRSAGGRETSSRRRDGLQSDGHPEADHLMVRPAEVRHDVGPGAFFRNPGKHGGGNAAGIDGAIHGMADDLYGLFRNQPSADDPVFVVVRDRPKDPGYGELPPGRLHQPEEKSWRTFAT